MDFKELMCCLSVLCHDSTDDKLRLCFDLFDTDRSGVLEIDEIKQLAMSLYRMGAHLHMGSLGGDSKSGSSGSDAKSSNRKTQGDAKLVQPSSEAEVVTLDFDPMLSAELANHKGSIDMSGALSISRSAAPSANRQVWDKLYHKLLTLDTNKDNRIGAL